MTYVSSSLLLCWFDTCVATVCKSGVPCNVIRLAHLSELRSKLGKESGFVEMDLSS